MKIQSAGFAMAMAFGMISGACGSGGAITTPGSGGTSTPQSGGSSGSGGTVASGGVGGSGGTVASGGVTNAGGSSNTGGTKATGGSSSSGGVTGKGGSTSSGGAGGGGGTCTNVTPCGGDVVATWTVQSSCLTVSGQLDMSLWSLGCSSAAVTGSLKVTGTWTAKSDGSYSDNTVTTGNETITMPAACLLISGTTTTCAKVAAAAPGFDSITCTDASGGGCTCAGTINQTGWPGMVSTNASTSGNYTTASNVLTIDSEAKVSYCISGSTMNWTPQSRDGSTITGTIVLQNGSTPGTGGAGGKGGATGSGGAAGAGGTTAKGGTTGAGGTTAKGGTTGSGGTNPSGGTTGTGGASTGGTTGTRGQGPCDIYAAGSPSTPCVAAYSMIRALSSTYSGPLYQVRKGSSSTNTGTGGTTTDIGMLGDGFADAASQDSFCSGSTCTVSIIYDQSGKKNDLKVAPAGCYNDGSANTPDYESTATKKSLKVGGHNVYALYMNAHEGYRQNKSTGLATVDEGIYELADGTHYGGACCWDFGNASNDNCNSSVMNTLFFGTGYWGTGAGSGPWFEGDFEGGVWACGSGASNANCPNNPSLKVPYAFGSLKTTTGKYAIRVADSASASDLTTAYNGTSPKQWSNKGGIILGIGGDNSNHSYGTFYEGAITNGYPSDATDLAVLKNVQAAKYGQ